MYAISNLAKSETFKINPWEWSGAEPATKESWNRPEVTYCFYSGYEGMIPGQRINDANPAVSMSHIVADYDQMITDDMVAAAVKKAAIKPSYSHKTKSGGARLVWELERPVSTNNKKLHESLMFIAAKKLNLKRLLPGFDEPAWKNAGQYYAVGTNWNRYDHGPISHNSIIAWQMEAGNRLNWRKSNDVTIPIETLSSEIERRWPGRWGGEWQYGARGKRFWDGSADNATAAVIRETGVQCFTGNKAFVPWSEILGNAFVEKYEADRLGNIIRDIYYDGRSYWRLDGSNFWRQYDRTNLITRFKVDGLSIVPGKGETASDIDRALAKIVDDNRVEASGNYLFRPQGIIYIKGKRVLNKSTVVPCAPVADPVTEWGRGFAFIAEFLDGFFSDKAQLDHFLAWLRHAYRGAIRMKPNKGHNIFIVGGINSGKTLLSDLIISGLFGGHYDASDHITKGGEFSNGAFDHYLWTVGDAKPIADGRSKKQFTAALKALAANRDHKVNEKYEKGYMTDWFGRVFITANDDPESISILPDVDQSNEDKVNFYRCHDQRRTKWPDDLDGVVAEELPYFGSWLLATDHADWIERDIRYGITSFHETELFRAAQSSSDGGRFEELLWALRNDLLQEDGRWTGTVTDLINAIASATDNNGASRDWNTVTAGRVVNHLIGSRDYIWHDRKVARRGFVIDFERFKQDYNADEGESAPF